MFNIKSAITAIYAITASVSFLFGQATPTVTKPANFEDVQIFKISLLVRTANITDAGTDDQVFVKFNASMAPFYLNNSGDDRERAGSDTYFITDASIKKIRDIKDLTISKQGTDGWALTYIQLTVNDHVIYESTLNNHWIDGDDGKKPELIILSSTLRNAGKWSYVGNGRIFIYPRMITKWAIEHIIETLVGNALRYDVGQPPYQWATGTFLHGNAVEAKWLNERTLSVDLDLMVKTLNGLKEVDVDFDLVLTCNVGKINITVQPIKDTRLTTKLKVISEYLNKVLSIPDCTAKFETNGDLYYY